MDKEMKIAVLIDAENVSSRYVNIILREASSLGNLIYKRIYGNWTTSLLNSWKNELLDNAIQPIQQYSNTVGKNSSDSALIIDAMDLLYQKQLDAFCIVSSDSDFTRLASRLRESEMFVLGMGEQKTPRAFISACNKFVYLDLLYKANKEAASKSKSKGKQTKKQAEAPKREQQPKKQRAAQTDHANDQHRAAEAEETAKRAAEAEEQRRGVAAEHASQPTADAEGDEQEAASNGSDILVVEQTLRDVAEEFSSDDGWILSARLGAYLSRRLPDFDTRNFGFRKFVPFIESLGIFETKKVDEAGEGGTRNIYFRLIEE